MKQIQFAKNNHDDFIDFIKAFAILGVLFVHTYPATIPGTGLFFGIDVPLFLLIQVFHFYKRDSFFSISKAWRRVFFPFFIIQSFLCFFVLFKAKGDITCLTGGVTSFGYGPGSYYPLIYIQMALLLVWLKSLIKKYSKAKLLIFFLLIAEGLEIICSLVNPPEWLYRLLIFRYIFLIYLGYLWVKDGIIINAKMIFLSILSAIAVLYFVYCTYDKEPWFFNTAWNYSRWPCYYWIANGFTCLLWYIWKQFEKSHLLCKIVKNLSKVTWEVYLMQMAVIFLINRDMMLTDNNNIQYALYLIIIWTFSIVGGIYLNKIWSSFLYGNK